MYRAVDERLGRTVAIKLLQQALVFEPVFIRRFEAEAKAAAQLNHPNILKVYDWGVDGEPYLVMEYLENGSLRDLYRRGVSLDRAQVIRLGEETASALAHAHERHFLHRDIKPANLLFGSAGGVRLADFGLVRALSEATVTESGVFGTPRYMAPEQVEGKAAKPASDVYSLGLVLYEAMTGSIPFAGDSPAALALARLTQPVGNPQPGDELFDLLISMLARNPSDRPSAAEVQAVLKAQARQMDPPDPIDFTSKQVPVAEAILDGSVSEPEGHPGAGRSAVAGAGARTVANGLEAASVTEFDGDDQGSYLPAGLTRSITLDDLSGAENDLAGKRSAKANILIKLLGLLLLAALISGTWFAYTSFLRQVRLPALTGMPSSEAVASLKKLGFRSVATSYIYSSNVPTGDVVTTKPNADLEVRLYQRISVLVSKGHAPVVVPQFDGTNGNTAVAKAKSLGFQVTEKNVYSSSVAPGIVMDQSITAGMKARWGSALLLTVSAGPPPRPVPNVVGDSSSRAETLLSGAGFKFAVQQAYSNTVASGDVISESPSAGSDQPYQSAITLVISVGPHYVTVPNVYGDSLKQAAVALQAQGLSIGQVVAPFGGNTVVGQSPQAGQTVIYGSAVNVLVAPG